MANDSPSTIRWRRILAAACLAALAALATVRTVRSSPAPTATLTGTTRELASTSIASAVPSSPAASPATPVTAARVALGRTIFFDSDLSEPRGTSCATCHDPKHGFAGNNGSTLGVAQGSRPGHFARRNTPSVLYLAFIRPFHMHWDENAPLPDAAGGFFWDGRVDSIVDVARAPLLNPDEMNNRDARQVAGKIKASAYASDFRNEFGEVLEDPEATLKAVGQAEEAFLKSPEMAPFSSKYDDFIQGRATLSPLETRGLKLFRDHAKGACDGCHKLRDSIPNPTRSLFTNFQYDVVAVPRNPRLAGNADPSHFDLGLCEHPQPNLRGDDERFCGAFRVPSLRNVATRTSFMHNGAFSKLRDVVAFYATRGTDPARWYKGKPFDDLPAKYRPNVNILEAPYNRGVGRPPALDSDEIDAIVAFLGTLTDAPFAPEHSSNDVASK
jgi:cytochrome c peroxidase